MTIHIGYDGEPHPCHASSPDSCPCKKNSVDGTNGHYQTMEAAYAALEEKSQHLYADRSNTLAHMTKTHPEASTTTSTADSVSDAEIDRMKNAIDGISGDVPENEILRYRFMDGVVDALRDYSDGPNTYGSKNSEGKNSYVYGIGYRGHRMYRNTMDMNTSRSHALWAEAGTVTNFIYFNESKDSTDDSMRDSLYDKSFTLPDVPDGAGMRWVNKSSQDQVAAVVETADGVRHEVITDNSRRLFQSLGINVDRYESYEDVVKSNDDALRFRADIENSTGQKYDDLLKRAHDDIPEAKRLKDRILADRENSIKYEEWSKKGRLARRLMPFKGSMTDLLGNPVGSEPFTKEYVDKIAKANGFDETRSKMVSIAMKRIEDDANREAQKIEYNEDRELTERRSQQKSMKTLDEAIKSMKRPPKTKTMRVEVKSGHRSRWGATNYFITTIG